MVSVSCYPAPKLSKRPNVEETVRFIIFVQYYDCGVFRIYTCHRNVTDCSDGPRVTGETQAEAYALACGNLPSNKASELESGENVYWILGLRL
jgi:hypothetical protein